MKNRGAFKTILIKGDFAFTAPNKVNRDHLQLDPVEEAPTLCTESYTGVCAFTAPNKVNKDYLLLGSVGEGPGLGIRSF